MCSYSEGPDLLGSLTGSAMLLQAVAGKADSLVRLGMAGIRHPACSEAHAAYGRLRTGAEACSSHRHLTDVIGACLATHVQSATHSTSRQGIRLAHASHGMRAGAAGNALTACGSVAMRSDGIALTACRSVSMRRDGIAHTACRSEAMRGERIEERGWLIKPYICCTCTVCHKGYACP